MTRYGAGAPRGPSEVSVRFKPALHEAISTFAVERKISFSTAIRYLCVSALGLDVALAAKLKDEAAQQIEGTQI